jgi:hypothetical protein
MCKTQLPYVIVPEEGAEMAFRKAFLQNMQSIVRQLRPGCIHKLLYNQCLSDLFVLQLCIMMTDTTAL